MMDTRGFETEARLRREIAALQGRVADLMDIQIRAELYREKVLREFKELEHENWSLKSENEFLRQQLTQEQSS